jgi:chorismate-pyruvate lyase
VTAALAAASAIARADAVARLDAELAASGSATAVLERRCGGPVRAEVERGIWRDGAAGLRDRLGAGKEEVVAYRAVRLMCGNRVLSRAQNWYLAGRLTAEMNRALDGDAPFGAVIAPLGPRRHVLDRQRLSGEAVLRIRALVVDRDGRPLAEVVEHYQRTLVADR